MARKKRKIVLTVVFLIIISFAGLCTALFLMSGPEKMSIIRNNATGKPGTPPVRYKHLSVRINGNTEEINILEADPGDGRVEIKPVLSRDSVFGFEYLSSMVLRSKAYAAVNAGFFYEYGYPAGMVVIDSRLITGSSGRRPVFILHDKKAALKELNIELRFECSGRKLDVNKINSGGKTAETVLYTSEYGKDNRAVIKNITAVIEKDKIKTIRKCSDSTGIPDDGMLLTLYEPPGFSLNNLPFKEGDRVKFTYEPYLGSDAQAYECGSWVVKNGKAVIGERDEWVGVMTNRDPRTVIGINNAGMVILLTVDGRQPGYSIGLTGRELAEFLIGYGIKDAAMLDGGASTEMIVNNRIVNRPSFKRRERPLGGAIILKIN